MSKHSPRNHGRYVLPPARGDCPTGKVQFANRKQARRAARAMQDSALGVYDCPRCDNWHIGHMPERVRRGEVDKAAWLAAKGEL